MSAQPEVDIAYLDGIRLQRGLQAGIQNVIARRDHINRINVFPVADSDTGTNLALTMNAVLAGSRRHLQSNVSGWLTAISESALDGARGNSGAIFAQFLQGLADSTGEVAVLTPKRFVAAALAGARSAGEAIAEPQPGTMLSVIQDYANEVSSQFQRGVQDFRELLAAGLEGARTSLARTPEQLAVLKQAGVVDAGAQGFVYLLEGIQDYIDSGSLRDKYQAPALDTEEEFDHDPAAGAVTDLAFRYCTECMITGDGIDRRKLREALHELGGNSLVMAGTHRKVRIHMHVNEPGQLFELCEDYGAVTSCKADDMQLQT
ncbi:MAG: DAK2 domain-containing protein, partial [Gammaproteobacteria bacterium]|nr:DAK2 domain-containing protein [Gammaproteobacteria bacterium]